MKLNTSTKHSLLLSAVLGIWVYLFLVIIGPFDVAPLNMQWRIQIMLGYGVIFSISYFVADQLNTKILDLLGKGSSWSAASFVLLFFLLNFLPTHFYYQSDFIQGEYPFGTFLAQIYLPTLLILVPLMLLGKWILPKLSPKTGDKIIFKGENKQDVLHLHLKDLLYVQSAQNYVEFHYLENGEVRKKMIRATLKKVQEEVPKLTRIHRFYLVNFDHFVCWNDKRSISLGLAVVPVSETYKKAVQLQLSTRP
ncbi:MAG: LytTR family DNA-binding domain-containing protein [Bacteroidota bacterium]